MTLSVCLALGWQLLLYHKYIDGTSGHKHELGDDEGYEAANGTNKNISALLPPINVSTKRNKRTSFSNAARKSGSDRISVSKSLICSLMLVSSPSSDAVKKSNNDVTTPLAISSKLEIPPLLDKSEQRLSIADRISLFSSGSTALPFPPLVAVLPLL